MSLPLVFLDFGMRGNAAPHLLEGWSLAEILGRWNDGLRCALTVSPVPYRGRMQLVVAVHPLHRPPEITCQRVLIQVNRRFLAEFDLTQRWAAEHRAFVCEIPPGAIRDYAANRIDFLLPDASLLPTDSRRLGVYFKYLSLEPSTPNRGHSLGPDRIAALDREREAQNQRHKELISGIAAARSIGDTERALQLCDEAAYAFPSWAEPHRIKSEILSELLRPAEAAAAIEQALAVEPANNQLRMARASLAAVYRQYDRAVFEIRKYLASEPSAKWPRFLLAEMYTELDWLDCAASAARRLRSLGLAEPDWIRETDRIAETFQKSRAEVGKYLRQRKPRQFSPKDILALGAGLCRIGWPRLALRLLAEHGQPGDTTEVYRIAANASRRCQTPSEAIAIAAIPSRLGISDPDHEFFRAKLAYEAGFHAEAARILRTLAEQDDANPAILDLLCKCLFMAREFTRLEDVARRWASRQPDLRLPSMWALAALVTSGRQPVLRGIPERTAPTDREPLIPRIIFQYWNTPEIPRDVAGLMRIWAEQNPEFEHVVFDRGSARRFLQSRFEPDVVGAFDLCYHPAMEADLMRLAFLAVNGGVYVDADEQSRMPLARLFSLLDGQSFVAPIYDSLPAYVNNCFLCASAGHEIVCGALDAAVRLIHAAHADGKRADIWNETGPGQLTHWIANHILHGRSSDVALLSSRCYDFIGGSTSELAYKHGAGDWRR